MFKKAQNLIILLCITSCIYVIRNNYTSPTNLLNTQVTRLLQELRPSASLCDGVDIESDVTADDRARADDYRSALSNIRDGNPFIGFIEGPLPAGDFGTEYVVPVIKYTIPWIVFFAISVIACLAYLFTWCCCRHSKSERFKNICFILGILFLVFVIGASIAGLVVSRGFSKGGHRSLCKAALLFEELAYGDNNANWIGIRPAAERVTVVLDSFDSTVDNLDAVDGDFTEMQARLQPALAAVQSMYNNNRGRTVTRPNPEIGGTYTPIYIENLGPVSDPSTATGTLQLEMEAKQIAVEQASNAINLAITELRQNRAQYQQDLNTGREFANLTTNSVDDVIAKVDEFGNDASRIIDGINGALLGVYITKLVIATFAILMILIVCIGAKFFNKCIHLSWCALGLIVIFTWALAAVVYPFSLILFEGCEVADRVITDPEFFDITFNKFISSSTDYSTERARQVVRQCMFGDGEILAVFGLQGKVNMFDPIFQALDNTTNLTDTIQAVPDSIAIPANQQLIQSFRDGTTPDATESGQDLVTLNNYIVNNLRQCSRVQDIWVFNSEQCPTGSGPVFATANAADFNMGSLTCIGFNVWGDRDINDRYSTATLPPGSCGTTDAYLSNYVGRFVQSRQEVEELFSDLQDSLDAVATANTAFMESVKAVTRRFDPIREDTLVVYNALANNETGLLSNTNCAFIKESVQSLHDSLCVEAISSLFQTTVDIIVLSFMGLFATFFVFCLTRKFSVERKRDERQIPETYKSPKA